MTVLRVWGGGIIQAWKRSPRHVVLLSLLTLLALGWLFFLSLQASLAFQFIFGVFGAGIVGMVASEFRPVRVIVGREGVWVERRGRAAVLVEYDQIADVMTADDGQLLLRTLEPIPGELDKRGMFLPVVAGQDRLRGAIQSARRQNELREREPIPALLRRGDRPFDRWVTEVRASSLSPTYRDASLADQLVRVAEDPSAAPDVRAVAAAGVAAAGSLDHRSRVRVAASECAQPDLADVLERAAKGDVDAVRLRRVRRRMS